MPRDRNVRERRREAILEILSEREVVKEQKDLGASVLVSRILNDANWSEVAGTMATLDDKVLILADAEQKRLFQRLKTFMYDVP
jgi:arginine repressor